jgi:PAS domain S-box-containing protein
MEIDQQQQMATEEKLKQIADEWQTTFDAITDPVMVLDQDFRIIRVNKATLEFLDLPFQSVVGNYCFRLMHGTDTPPPSCPLAKMISSKQHEEAEFFDGERGKWLFVSVDPILDKNSKITGVVHIVKDISERKRWEEALKESETKFRDLAEKSLAGVYLIQDGLFRYVNPRFAEIHGYTVEEIVDHKSPKDMALPEDLAMVSESIQKRISGDVNYLQFTFRIRTKQQEIRYLEAYGSRTIYRGKPAVIGTLLDITDRKRSERALDEEKQRFQTLVDNAPFAMVLREPGGNFTYLNPQFKALFGYDLNDLPNGAAWYEKAYPDPIYRQKVLFAWQEDYQEGRTDQKSEKFFSVTCKDGTKKEIHFRGVQLSTGEIVMSCEDITERRRAQEALRESEFKYRSVVETSLVGFYIVQDGFFRFVNQRFCEINGYSYEELVDKMSPLDLIHPEDRPMAKENIEKRLSGKIASIEYSFRVIRKDGQVITVKILGTTMSYNGRTAVSGTVIDITREKTLEAQLRQSEKMQAIGTLAGGLAHDFNNLLMTILGYTSLLLLDIDPLNPAHEKLKIIENQVQNGADLTKQLLGFARGGKYEVKPTDLNELLTHSSDLFGRTKKEIRVFRNMADNLWKVEVDQGQIEQVFLNLMVNAWQAMPGGGELYLETSNFHLDQIQAEYSSLPPGNYVKVSITDTGTGMDETTKQRLFEPFFTTKEMSRGTGLGLASSYGIVRNHNGHINVYSEKGKGATFTIYLPATEKTVIPEIKVSTELVKGSETVLLVDDQEEVLKVGKAILEKLGYTVLLASSGEEALEVYKAHQRDIALVILDMVMPVMGGGETFSRLKELKPNLKTLLSSGYSLNGQASKIIEMGCDGFIQKPFNVSALSKKIREVLG